MQPHSISTNQVSPDPYYTCPCHTSINFDFNFVRNKLIKNILDNTQPMYQNQPAGYHLNSYQKNQNNLNNAFIMPNQNIHNSYPRVNPPQNYNMFNTPTISNVNVPY